MCDTLTKELQSRVDKLEHNSDEISNLEQRVDFLERKLLDVLEIQQRLMTAMEAFEALGTRRYISRPQKA